MYARQVPSASELSGMSLSPTFISFDQRQDLIQYEYGNAFVMSEITLKDSCKIETFRSFRDILHLLMYHTFSLFCGTFAYVQMVELSFRKHLEIPFTFESHWGRNNSTQKITQF